MPIHAGLFLVDRVACTIKSSAFDQNIKMCQLRVSSFVVNLMFGVYSS